MLHDDLCSAFDRPAGAVRPLLADRRKSRAAAARGALVCAGLLCAAASVPAQGAASAAVATGTPPALPNLVAAASAPASAASAAFVVTVTAGSGVTMAKPPAGMDETTKMLLASLLGVVAGWLTAWFKLRLERDAEREKDRENVRLKVLNPLLIAAEDFLDRITDIARRRKHAAKGPEMIQWFRTAKELPRHDAAAFARWCNDEGYFALSTLYVTALYFHYAGTIRRDFPFFDLARGDKGRLLALLSDIRLAIGGKFGIWEAMQDSLGRYAAQEGSIKNYRQFCEMFVDDKQSPWLGRLLDFYRDVHLKLDDQFANIEDSLRALIVFLRTSMEVSATTYTLDAKSLECLRQRQDPALLPHLAGLQPLQDQRFADEQRFVAAVVAAIGQDAADDYKPSILKCTLEKRAAAG